MPIISELRHFKRTEFKRPELVDDQAARYLDEVRHRYGFPLIITDDARIPGEAPPGASLTSLHYDGRAFDLRWITPAHRLYHFVECAMEVANWWMLSIELELVNSARDKHIHIGLQRAGVASELIVAGD